MRPELILAITRHDSNLNITKGGQQDEALAELAGRAIVYVRPPVCITPTSTNLPSALPHSNVVSQTRKGTRCFAKARNIKETLLVRNGYGHRSRVPRRSGEVTHHRIKG